MHALQHCPAGGSRAVQLLLPFADGFILRPDFLEQRLVDCALVERVVGFAEPLQRLSKTEVSQLDLAGLLGAAVGGILLPSSPVEDYASHFHALHAELDARLAIPWILPNPIQRRRIVFVHKNKELWTEQPFVQCIRPLGLDLLAIGPEGHWYSREANKHLCEGFVAIDPTVDDGLPQRIAAAVQSYGKEVHGIVTFNDAYHAHVATAAEILGLPTEPPSAYQICEDKYATRQLLDGTSSSSLLQTRSFPTSDSLKQYLSSTETPFNYPVVIKPAKGCSSEGVYIAHTSSDLLALSSTTFSIAKGADVIVETYLDGPEFNAEYVLVDGKVVFFELQDDYPCAGDVAASQGGDITGDGGFAEIGMIIPSALPTSEIELVKNSCHEALLKAGFMWGVFHVEGRIQGSSVKFSEIDGQGWELVPREEKEKKEEPRCVVLEINPRTPGIGCSIMSIRTYGMDYYALQTLMCIRDKERVLALARPFSYPPDSSSSTPREHQYHSESVRFPATHAGRCMTPDALSLMLDTHPELAPYVKTGRAYFHEGDRVSDPKQGRSFLGFVIVGAETREKVKSVAEAVRKAWKMEIVP
ncbi:hypothetical protein DL96DRAFT_1471162 [Flagelloscypha sp. PMI_526]|nr:hypothetical protein DL96DRAFT_1471162 [Flagelloscypha sp. PMI_526]